MGCFWYRINAVVAPWPAITTTWRSVACFLGNLTLPALLLGLCSHPCWLELLLFIFWGTDALVLGRPENLLNLDLFSLLFVCVWKLVYSSPILAGSPFELMFRHTRGQGGSICQTEVGQATTGWIWVSKVKNENYRNVILNVSVSHNLFVSNKTLFGDGLGRGVRGRSHGLCSCWAAHRPALGLQKICVVRQEAWWQRGVQKQGRNRVYCLGLAT